MFIASGGSPIFGASFRVCAVARLAISADAAAAKAMMARAEKFPVTDWFSLLSFL
jgi:hypothetical protein